MAHPPNHRLRRGREYQFATVMEDVFRSSARPPAGIHHKPGRGLNSEDYVLILAREGTLTEADTKDRITYELRKLRRHGRDAIREWERNNELVTADEENLPIYLFERKWPDNGDITLTYRGLVTVAEAKGHPADDSDVLEFDLLPRSGAIGPQAPPVHDGSDDISEHTRLQWEIIRIGLSLGHNVVVAENDGGKTYRETAFRDVAREGFADGMVDTANCSKADWIDVAWVDAEANRIVELFEVVNTTDVDKAALRMCDVALARQDDDIGMNVVVPQHSVGSARREAQRKTLQELVNIVDARLRTIPYHWITAHYNEVMAKGDLVAN